ncbi:MAG: hypothetical protein ACW96X_04660 [Promethearchaeota archaeon]|jgi:hypothetical protein
MTTFLEEFWIFSKDGIPYVNFFKENLSNSHFNHRHFNGEAEIAKKVGSMLISEEQSLAKKNLIFFEYKNSQYIITSCLNGYLHLVLKSSLEVKVKKLNNISKIIGGMIKSLYMTRDFREWEGDLKKFDNFKKKIDLYFKMSSL